MSPYIGHIHNYSHVHVTYVSLEHYSIDRFHFQLGLQTLHEWLTLFFATQQWFCEESVNQIIFDIQVNLLVSYLSQVQWHQLLISFITAIQYQSFQLKLFHVSKNMLMRKLISWFHICKNGICVSSFQKIVFSKYSIKRRCE